jgi:DNA processing protein
MTLDQAVALSLVDDLPRIGLTERLRAMDPELHELAAAHLSRARDVRARAGAAGIVPLPWNDRRFPAALLAIPDCPPLMWCRGAIDCFDAPAVAIVGSRAASAVSLELAAQLAADLAAYGIIVVSGLARGVDSAAHRGALQAGRTIAVLGSGVDRIYPREHVALAGEIAESGLVVSEFAPGAAPLKFRFPLRNRVISGLSRAVVVIEASENSGSLITVACALEQGREVMAVPGNVLSGRNRGGHALIRDGARIVESAEDVLEELHLGCVPAPSDGVDAETNDGRSKACDDPLLARMASGQPYDLDALAVASGLAISRLLMRLSDLELLGLIHRVDGGRFVRRG